MNRPAMGLMYALSHNLPLNGPCALNEYADMGDREMADKSDELGALWVKSGPKGDYMTGKVGDVAVVAFKNDRKKNPKEPDWRILKARPRADIQADTKPPVDDDPIGF